MRTIEKRLETFLAQRRFARSDAASDTEFHPAYNLKYLQDRDLLKIRRRAILFCERHKASSGMAHLSEEDQQKLAVLEGGIKTARLVNDHEADEIAAALHQEMPWMADATEHVWNALRSRQNCGGTGMSIPPVLLVGPRGIGKSHWARLLAKLIGAPKIPIDATGEPASFALVGSQKGWSSAQPGKLMNGILAHQRADPLVIIDEVEKAGDSRSNTGTQYNLSNSLLPLLEPATAAEWQCPYFQVQFDTSRVNWVLTANSLDTLPAPLLSRCKVIALSGLSKSQLLTFIDRQAQARQLSTPAKHSVKDVVERLWSDGRRFDLRSVDRILERAAAMQTKPRVH
ncbi:AAA family ATPase [Tritonibacter multivorans]|uniref:AAA family ATPase n=1 Tax=Tritonibacter multivorans TaxID=928856 RepID=UPI001041B81A|nr:AAA family ATPase [Tritonibacter multivorans]MDA7421691.1 AAA family ATPase [Tritonibacter multivorans]